MSTKIFLALGLSVLLVACGSKPDVSAVEPMLKEGWAACPGIKIFDIQKTNGIERSNGYEMAVSFKLEILETEKICNDVNMLKALQRVIELDKSKQDYTLKIGEVLKVNTSYLLEKSEKGWIVKE
ncbi:MAG: hypothetical protein QM520_05475 [Gammaproteobacteria bacterium]|nr:hypothetical protein [Gammaproteobacteria bacterium]